MLLSDRLIEIGKTANPKSNLSMATKEIEMIDAVNVHIKSNPVTEGQIRNILKLVCKGLNDSGYNFYRPENFITL
jgi:hypothetical protein